MNQLCDTFPEPPGARRRFTVDEFERMGMAGILGPDERVELIAGEIIAMSPAGRFHEVLRGHLAQAWSRKANEDRFVMAVMQLRLADDDQPVIDIGVLPFAVLPPDARGPDMLLVVEVADSSLAWDTKTKALVYAAAGVREYWVINARTRATLVHREPGPDGYQAITGVAAGEVVTPLLVPEVALRLTDLPAA